MVSYQKESKDGSSYAPHTGLVNNLVIYIRFADDGEFSTKRQVFDDALNLTSGASLKSYFSEISYNNLTINSTHYPECALNTNLSYQDSHPRNYFKEYDAIFNPIGYVGGPDGDERREREHKLLSDAINWINTNSPIPTSLNIDADNDNRVDNVCFIVKGNATDRGDIFWSHRWILTRFTLINHYCPINILDS